MVLTANTEHMGGISTQAVVQTKNFYIVESDAGLGFEVNNRKTAVCLAHLHSNKSPNMKYGMMPKPEINCTGFSNASPHPDPNDPQASLGPYIPS